MTTKTDIKHNRRQFLKTGAQLAAATTAAALLSGCGQKGPLYIPGDEKKKKKKS